MAVDVVGQIDEDAFSRSKRGGATTAQALAEQGVPHAERATAAWVERIEDDRWLSLDHLLPGAVEAIGAVREAGLRPLVLTARTRADGARSQLDSLGLADLELVVVSPGAAAVEKAERLRRLGAAGLVGDSEADIAAASAAGVPWAVVETGQRDASFLRVHGAETVYPIVEAAVSALLRSVGAGASGAERT